MKNACNVMPPLVDHYPFCDGVPSLSAMRGGQSWLTRDEAKIYFAAAAPTRFPFTGTGGIPLWLQSPDTAGVPTT